MSFKQGEYARNQRQIAKKDIMYAELAFVMVLGAILTTLIMLTYVTYYLVITQRIPFTN